VRIVWERLDGSFFDPTTWNTYSQQKPLDERFDRLLRAVADLEAAVTIDDFVWPEDVPAPVEGLRIVDQAQKATFDLICMAGGFVFAHELRHALFDRVGTRPALKIDEERECDHWALALMLDGVPRYADATSQDEMVVRAKRLLGIVFALLAVVTLTPRPLWDETAEYPAVSARLRVVLDVATANPVPEWFWTTIASMLTAFARSLGFLPPPGPFPPADRDLAYALCEGLRSV